METSAQKFPLPHKEKEKMKSNKEVALQLISQLIDQATAEDRERKAALVKAHKAQQAVGESFSLFHLKALKELILEL